MRTLRVFSNIDRFETATAPGVRLEHTPLGPGRDRASVRRDFEAARDADVVIVNADTRLLVQLCLLSLTRRRRFKLVSLDIVLAPPRGALSRLATAAKKFLLRQVDLFIVYQRDLRGYGRYYGVTPARSRTIPFKVNLWERLRRGEIETGDDGRLLFVGRTFRDVPTFVEAARRSGVPVAMVRHSGNLAAAHGTSFGPAVLPPNLHEIVHDAGHDSWVQMIARSRGVVLAIQPGTINCAGISTLYDAMALGKPVIITESPATREIFTADDVALVPPGDADALARALTRVSTDEGYRAGLVARGHEIAAQVGGEQRLYDDTLCIVSDLVAHPR